LKDDLLIARRLQWMRETLRTQFAAKRRAIVDAAHGVRPGAPPHYDLKRRGQLRWLHPRHFIAGQRAGNDDKFAAE